MISCMRKNPELSGIVPEKLGELQCEIMRNKVKNPEIQNEKAISKTFVIFPWYPMYSKPYTHTSSIILLEPRKIRNRVPTLESRRICLLRHKPILPRRAIAPLRRRLSTPRPVEPALGSLERRHLRLGVSLQELLVAVRIVGEVGVGVGTATGWTVVSGWTIRSCGFGVVCPFPARAAAYIVEVFGAVGVSLGPFAADGRAPSEK